MQHIFYCSRHISERDMLYDDLLNFLTSHTWTAIWKICAYVENNIISICLVGDNDDSHGRVCNALMFTYDESEERQPAKIQADLISRIFDGNTRIVELFYVKNENGLTFIFIVHTIRPT